MKNTGKSPVAIKPARIIPVIGKRNIKQRSIKKPLNNSSL